jgi:hypothetical protein
VDHFETIPLDRGAAENVHYANDNGIRALAQARWRMKTGGSREAWPALGKDHPDNLIPEARDWVCAERPGSAAISFLPVYSSAVPGARSRSARPVGRTASACAAM